jgi:phenylacetate-CoA ligase
MNTVVSRRPNPEELEPIERASIDELRALQLERLRSVVAHAYANVAPYRAKCAETGVTPSDLRGLEDLARFPFTVKDDLRQSYPFGMFAVPPEDIVRVHASSGTTGKPTVVGYTRNDIENWSKLVARSIRACGGRRGDRVHIAYGYGLFTGGLGAHYGAERLGLMVIPMSGGQTPKQVQLIHDLRPDIIMCTPSYLLNIADEFEVQGLDPAECSLRVGILGAEPWGEEMRAEIERRFALDALDIYGLSEVMGPGVACECLETKDGPVIWEDHFYPEIIDPESGRPLPDGEPGELVITTLTKEALPVIRYRTRDLTRLLPGTARTMRRIAKITGRNDDMLIIRGVNVFPTQIEERVLKQPGLSPHYQLRVSREASLDVLTVEVERKADTAAGSVASVAEALKQAIKDFVGVSTTVRVLEPGGVPRSAGKAVRVIDERK